ncbi:MAG: glycosyltransferase family 39 protein [Bacteroidota bacterium]
MRSNRFFGLLIGAMFLFILYFIVALYQHNFAITSFDYIKDIPTFFFGVPNQVFQSQLWKIIFLLPATVLFSVAFTRAGFQFSIPEKINYRLIVSVLLLTVTIILVLSTQFLFQETEVTDDENAYDFQAKTLLASRFINPPPPVLGKSMDDKYSDETSFDNWGIINDGHQWVGKYTLGHPAIIALGMALGNRYIVIIGISVLTLLLIYLIAEELYNDKKIALLAFCLGCVSPFFYFVSSSRLSHTTSAFFLALFMYLFLRLRHIQTWQKKALMALLVGLVLGYAFNTRQLTAIGFSFPFIIVWLMDHRQFPKRTFLIGLLIFIGFSFMLALTLWYNSIVTGNWLQFPFHYYCPIERIGFSIRYTPSSALHNLAISIVRMNGPLFGFPLSLLFVFVFFFAKKEFADRLLFGILGSIAFAYCFYYGPGVQDLGPIYYYETIIPLFILSARGIFFLYKTIFNRFDQGKVFILHFLVISCIMAFATYIPERISHIARLTEQIRKPYKTVRSANIHNALIMIKLWQSQGAVSSYRSPSPKFTDDIVFCLYTDSVSNRTVLNYFSKRAPYFLQYDKENDLIEIFPLDRKTLQPVSPQKIDIKKQ